MRCAGDRKLMEAIAKVGQKLKAFNASDPRLPALREYFAAASQSLPAPPRLSREWLSEWEEFLGLSLQSLPERPSGQNCDRCDQKGMPRSSQEVAGYGYRATCTQCGHAWVVRFVHA